MATALVTGPTAGLGRGFAEALARKGLDLVLVARDEARLLVTADELSARYGVSCEVLTADLAVPADVDRVAARLRSDERPVSVLVNNAGFGILASFASSQDAEEQRLVHVLVTAVMRLTHAVLPGMVARGAGLVVNVSSVAGWINGGTYSAAKAWVTVFSESLAQQLDGTGVRVVAACPGFVHTEFHERAGMDMTALPAFMWLDVPAVVDQAFRDAARGRSVSVTGLQYRAASWLLRHGPRCLARAATATRRNPRFGGRD